MRADIVPGATFPDYELTEHTKARRKLSEVQGGDPMIVVLSRGLYCPKDHWQHRRLVEFYPEIVVGYAQIVTISTDNLIQANEMRTSLNAQWPFFSDPRRIIQKDLDIQEYTDPDHDPMIPHTFVLEPGLKIYKIYNGYWFFGRPTIEDLRHDLRETIMRIRPDWDLTTPSVRQAWEEGRKFAHTSLSRRTEGTARKLKGR